MQSVEAIAPFFPIRSPVATDIQPKFSTLVYPALVK
jgi:hypothetical protein